MFDFPPQFQQNLKLLSFETGKWTYSYLWIIRQILYRVFKSKRYKLNSYCAGYLDPTDLRLVTFFYWQSDICEYIFDTEQQWVWILLFSCIAEIKKAKKFLKIHWKKTYILRQNFVSAAISLPLGLMCSDFTCYEIIIYIFNYYKRTMVWK